MTQFARLGATAVAALLICGCPEVVSRSPTTEPESQQITKPTATRDEMALGDLLVVGIQDRVYRRSGGMWDSGIALPSGERSPVGLDVDPTNGDILLTGTNTDRIYGMPKQLVPEHTERLSVGVRDVVGARLPQLAGRSQRIQ